MTKYMDWLKPLNTHYQACNLPDDSCGICEKIFEVLEMLDPEVL